MHFAREGYPWILGLGVVSFVLGLLHLQSLSLLFLAFALFAAVFFRDPEREIPPGEKVIVSPADGRVVALEKGPWEERFLRAPASRVSIFMSPFDVHVNRIPVSGRVTQVHYQTGQFRAAFVPEASSVNEQNAVLIEDRLGHKVLLVQVAGMVARRIFCSLKGGEEVTRGERYGMIAFGSRVDLYHSPEVVLRVQVGERVRAGETIIGEYP
ncbi:MAG: phosphatidylserine decarboxylase family protein [Deltaproteobacteria bacterium]|nr:phosphatidylserine decarboxylase family protein [Deltaproteobacteria bacterium]